MHNQQMEEDIAVYLHACSGNLVIENRSRL